MIILKEVLIISFKKLKIIAQKIVVKVKPVKPVNITIPTMVLNAVILPGMNMALIVLHLNITIIGIALDVPVLEMKILFVVMVIALAMKQLAIVQ